MGESLHLPLLYYENNIGGTLVLLELLDKYNCHHLVFSSSATVYGTEPVFKSSFPFCVTLIHRLLSLRQHQSVVELQMLMVEQNS